MIQARTTTASASWAISGSERARGGIAAVRAGLLASVAALCLGGAAASQELPTGGTVAHGDVRIAQPGAGSMTITQGTNSAVVNWNSFSIGSGGHVDIRQPSTNSSMLNRVTGSTTSEIHGRLTANGRVHLVNPNGIFIGPTGTVNAGGFVASTLDISDEDFVAGRLQYRSLGNSATVENAGRVTIGRDGYAALLGGRVRNSGVVTVPMGKIAFGSGERAVLDLSGDQFLQVAVPTGGEDGDQALIENSGLASAQGGLIEMRAATAREAVRQAVNLDGVAEARSVSVRGGAIVLGGGAGGVVNVSGRVSTRSEPSALIIDESKRPPKAPEITITGQRIRLAGAEIDASGQGGGGLIRIGGDFAGAGDLPRADDLTVDDATTIRADAIGEGDGGRIALWSDIETEFFGTASARGGDAGGNGGFIEVSSKLDLTFRGLTDTRAANGIWGTTLLDPTDFVIEIEDEPVYEDLLQNNATVTIDANTVGGTDVGNVTVNATLDWDNNSTLFIRAVNDLFLNGGLNAENGSVDLNAINGDIVLDGPINAPLGTVLIDAGGTTQAGSGTGLDITASDLTFLGGTLLLGNFETAWAIDATSNLTVDVGTFDLRSGDWSTTGTGSTFAADDFQINQFSSTFQRIAGGTGTGGDPYQIFDIYGLQGIGTISGQYTLVNDIDATDASSWNNGEGFEPINSFLGVLDGGLNTVSNLRMAPLVEGDPDDAAFVLNLDGDSAIRNILFDGIDVTGSDAAGLVAFNQGLIENVSVQGSVSGTQCCTAGLVGQNNGTIEDSIADVEVDVTVSATADGFSFGGFVGQNNGTILRSHSLGDVTVTKSVSGDTVSVGAFVGVASGSSTLTDSYARGNVSVTTSAPETSTVNAGGFVGEMFGTVERSYSTGTVTVTGAGSNSIGGFGAFDGVGSGAGSSNFWDTETSGLASSAIGTGLTTAEFQDTETFISIAEAEGWDFEGTWAPGDTGFYPVNYSTSPVILAVPDDTSEQYGLADTATTTGSVFGGPADFVFDEQGDTLDTSGLFDDLDITAEDFVGFQAFGLSTTSLDSASGITYRVVDRPGIIEITPAPLAVTPDDATKTYGETFTPTNFTVTGTLFFGDTVDSVDLSVTDGADPGDPVDPGEGSYTIFIDEGGVSGTGLDNYIIDTEGTGTLTINPAPLTITPNDQTKPFGTEFVFTGDEFTTSGFAVEGDGIEEIFFFSEGAPAAAEPGSYPILLSGFEGSGLENYDITEGEGTMTVQTDGDSIPRPPVVIVIGLPNPTDTFEGDVTIGTGGAPGRIARQNAAETFARVQDIAGSLQIATDACGQSGGDVSRYLACLSDALDDFAGELDAISLELPPGMENVAQIIQTARTRIDGAATRAAARLATATTEAERQAIRREAANEARAALSEASNEIRKAITLVRAEDPELASLQRATITTVADAVDNVGIELARVTEL